MTGSGHIEITMHASAEVFTNSFDRFCSKNKVPEKTISDQGSNFEAFNTELKGSDNLLNKIFLIDPNSIPLLAHTSKIPI